MKKVLLFIPLIGLIYYLNIYLGKYGLLFPFDDKYKEEKDCLYIIYNMIPVCIILAFVATILNTYLTTHF
jgi:hypothetical protein